MSRSRKRNQKKTRATSDSGPAAGIPADLQKTRGRAIKRQFRNGLLLTVLIILVFHALEKIPQIHAAVEISYDWLQNKLGVVKRARDSVVVIDISNLPTRADPAHPEREPHTSREALTTIVEALLAREGKPRAIGIDVDFSLTEDGQFFTAGDRAFLEFLAGRREMRGRLFVGVDQGIERGPSMALGDQKFEPLAAYVVVPNEAGFGANAMLDERLEIPYIADPSREIRKWNVPSLAAAVAGVPKEPSWWLRWAVERRVTKEEGEGDARVTFQQFLVDFSPIDYNPIKVAGRALRRGWRGIAFHRGEQKHPS